MKLTESTPTYCASCYAQQPSKRHVDFEAAYDGPVVGSGFQMVIDDLILCEDCIKQAAELIGMVVPEGDEAKIKQIRHELKVATEGWTEAEKRLKAVEEVLA